jgi:hypothetical protein
MSSLRNRSARAKSSAPVIFRLRSSPGTMATSSPAARATSTSSAAPPGCAAVRGEDERKRNPCGVCARQRPVRSTVPATSPSAPRQSASVTASAGAAASAVPRASTTRAIRSCVTQGRATSWISTRSGAKGTSASSPARTLASRRAPPSATTTSGCPAYPGANPMSSGWSTSAIGPTRGEVRNASSVQAATARPATVRHCFGRPPPARRPRPAATMTAATVIRPPCFPTFVYGLRGIVTMLAPMPDLPPNFCAKVTVPGLKRAGGFAISLPAG